MYVLENAKQLNAQPNSSPIKITVLPCISQRDKSISLYIIFIYCFKNY